jgi:phosphate/sulfate permease
MYGFYIVTASAVTGVGAIERRARVNWRKVIEIFFIPGFSPSLEQQLSVVFYSLFIKFYVKINYGFKKRFYKNK